MFLGATAFDQPIGGWDVSNGEVFVSNERPKRTIGLKRSLVWLCFQLGMQSQVNPSPLMCGF
jgi:hypothetical protein